LATDPAGGPTIRTPTPRLLAVAALALLVVAVLGIVVAALILRQPTMEPISVVSSSTL